MSRPRPSLRTRLSQHVLVPLVITWAAGTAVTLALASHFTGQAFDRALLDDAYALAAHVTPGPVGKPVLNLSTDDMGTLLFDQSEAMFYAVYDDAGQLMGGHAGLRPPALPAGVTSQFSNMIFQGREMRSVSLRRTDPVQVEIVMAQTSATRNRLLQRMLTYSAIPQALLLIFLAWWLRRSIGRDLGPLATLQQALGRRDASDLRPVPDDATTDVNSRDVDSLRLALNSLLQRLSRSIDAQREFAGNVAHELRTPLAGIRAQASYALAQKSPEVWHEQLLGIAEGEQRASHLVEQLLALARADEGRAALQLQPVALDELVRDGVLRFLPKADAVGVDLGAEGLEQPTIVQGDVALIEGILGNLLNNALRYAVGPDASVTVSVLAEVGQTVLRVVDNGPGMSAQDMLFWGERWALGEAGLRLGEGAGLGLAIVRRYAELLGAEFSLTPGFDGRGLCASLRFGPPPA